MTDWWNKIIEKLHLPKWLDHQRFTVLGICLFAILIGGCTLLEGRTDSMTTPGKRVTQPQLELEIAEQLKALEAEAIILKSKGESLALKAAYAREDLYKNQATIDRIIGTLKLAVGSFIPPGSSELINLILGGLGGTALIAGGRIADGKRKDRVIAAMKNDAASPAM